jgi:hypothetical protein
MYIIIYIIIYICIYIYIYGYTSFYIYVYAHLYTLKMREPRPQILICDLAWVQGIAGGGFSETATVSFRKERCVAARDLADEIRRGDGPLRNTIRP